MENLQFNFKIVPGNQGNINMNFMEKPMPFEKDEIKLRDKFFYK